MTHVIRVALISIASVGLANAAVYHFALPMDSVIEGQELKAGQYRVEVNDTTAVIKGGKKSVETKVRSETTVRKNDATSVKYNKAGGNYNLQEIHVGGKKLNLVFEPVKSANGGL